MSRPGAFASLSGLPNAAAWAYAALSLLKKDDPLRAALPAAEPVVCVRAQEEDLEDVADALTALAPVVGIDAGAAFFGEEAETRFASLEKLHKGARIVLATPEALAASAPTAEEYAKRRLTIRPANGPTRKDLLAKLSTLGYARADFVEAPGEYAARGAVVDFFPWEPLKPVRVLYDGDAPTTLRTFDPTTQATDSARLDEVVVVPAHEKSADAPLGAMLAAKGLWLIEAGADVAAEPARAVSVGPAGGVDFGAAERYAGGGMEPAAAAVRAWQREGLNVLFFAVNRGEDERLQEMFDEAGISGLQHVVGPLAKGFVCKERGIALLSSAEIFGRRYRSPRAWRPEIGQRQRVHWGELKKGDYVVHELYGIARYLGLEAVEGDRADPEADDFPRRQDGTRRLGREDPLERREARSVQDCLRLEFRGRDTMFVPMSDFRQIQKYVGGEGHRPRLSSLDARTWKDVKERVKEGVRKLAEQLLKVQAQRRAVPGHAYPADSHMEREFAESFPYEETPDQTRAIAEVNQDMTAPQAMDRVIVGDVGFGKTEVAMRAALKAVADARQVAVLVPTTILADQHFRNFSRRFAEYPVRLAMLSRFQTKKEQAQTLADAAAGKIDIVVGTHRLLQKDIKFQRLGLLVIDEEHRFGVAAKEKLKALKKNVDCLTMSATPIPRTLHQCLSGLRQISLIQTPPAGRQPILTGVRSYDDKHVKRAIEEELARGGQVFYVHNRVRTLPDAVRRLEALLPQVRFCMAHGQMKGERLEKTMWSFFERKHDVLVASTIIESGLDIPSVNTLLIENAQDFGLSQLYQMRGRIGRERRRAFCYLYYPASKKEFGRLSEEARKRLEALRDFGELGSGFTLAMRDLEIRGAGDLLGAQQSGFLNAVGVEFYGELLEDEINKLKGKKKEQEPPAPAHLDLALPAHLPQEYVPGDLERITFYKRILAADAPGIAEVRRELTDLSGPPPTAVENLFHVVGIRRAATAVGVRSVVQRGRRVELYFHKAAAVPVDAIQRWVGAFGDKIEFVNAPEGDGLRVFVDGREPVAWLEDFLEGLARAAR